MKASRRKALRAAMMEEFKVAEEAREANVRLNQLSQEEVKAYDIVIFVGKHNEEDGNFNTLGCDSGSS